MFSRRSCLIVLLLVLLSQFSMTVHAASHTTSDYASCQLCIAHHNTGHALTAATIELKFAPAAEQFISFVPLVSPISRPIPYQQRGPPLALQNH